MLRGGLKGHLQLSYADNHYPCIYNALSTHCQEDYAHTHTHMLFPLYLTEPNYRHLSLSDETKKNCSIFRLMESEVSLSFLFFFSPSQRLLSSLRDASPAAHPLIWRLILDLLNKTQIKTDNEESFPLTATFICFDCYSESWMAVYVRSVKMAASAILSLRPASLVVKQNRRAHPWP